MTGARIKSASPLRLTRPNARRWSAAPFQPTVYRRCSRARTNRFRSAITHLVRRGTPSLDHTCLTTSLAISPVETLTASLPFSLAKGWIMRRVLCCARCEG
ncbi:hypothetical protein BO82DRAFT_63364 [Aspergillus uvarum CBS 121591]|uniref:Uncharacterized protein n=1 Tax=Aspergillus uvarum CBS 121591 TaxID=1448315 RepID=A0A319CE69_9EURO|nr:hypothetical protein BO82DRAFT_63364 [Aspergillus uvarum CBS 121591]PYH82529.1 hypothetical protein BO82DRAFT_63364 [Aspergillus uvarum CBS 121591]